MCDPQAIVEHLQRHCADPLPPALRTPERGADRAHALFVEIDNPVRRHLQTLAPLVACCERRAARVGR